MNKQDPYPKEAYKANITMFNRIKFANIDIPKDPSKVVEFLKNYLNTHTNNPNWELGYKKSDWMWAKDIPEMCYTGVLNWYTFHIQGRPGRAIAFTRTKDN